MRNIIAIVKNIVTKFLFKLFRKKKTKELEQDKDQIYKDIELKKYVYDKSLSFTKDMFQSIDWKSIPSPVIENPEQQRSIILVDDIPYTELLYRNDMDSIKSKYNLDISKEFKIIKCFGEKAGFIAYKYVVLENHPVDFAFIDITLGHKIKVFGSWYKEFDGIDLAISMSQEHENLNFYFCTAHTLNKTNTTIANYNKKIEKYFNKPIDKFYIGKNTNRAELIYDIVRTFLDKEKNYDNKQEVAT